MHILSFLSIAAVVGLTTATTGNVEKRGSITNALIATGGSSGSCPTGQKKCGSGCVQNNNICCENTIGAYCMPYETCITYNSNDSGWACWYSKNGDPAPTNAGSNPPSGTTGSTAGVTGSGQGSSATAKPNAGSKMVSGNVKELVMAAVPLVMLW